MSEKMYSEKVMEHFRNPRNMGEMENPDVIAKIGNPACVLPKTKIHKKDSSDSIKELREGDKVVGHDGRVGEIDRTIQNQYDGKILEIRNELGEVHLTPDHLVKAIKTSKDLEKNQLNRNVAWHHAVELKEGDKIPYPIQFIKKDKRNGFDKLNEEFLITQIEEINEKSYSGTVNNLEVGKTKSFLTQSFPLHNCGDVMEIYLRVGENKEGKKIIEDIKFKTFGCAAAIATSSVTTEMVKGMTLDEAEKIDNQDVAEELGGLPKIKMHCSNLSANGLHKALYKYREKHGMEISDDLEAKYRASEKALEKTEEMRGKIED